jgi:hypothetical protein
MKFGLEKNDFGTYLFVRLAANLAELSEVY